MKKQDMAIDAMPCFLPLAIVGERRSNTLHIVVEKDNKKKQKSFFRAYVNKRKLTAKAIFRQKVTMLRKRIIGRMCYFSEICPSFITK